MDDGCRTPRESNLCSWQAGKNRLTRQSMSFIAVHWVVLLKFVKNVRIECSVLCIILVATLLYSECV